MTMTAAATAQALTGQLLLEDATPAELSRMALVESVLPALAANAADADVEGRFHLPHVKTLSEAGLLGLVVPQEFGGLGGGLRDLTAATFAMGTACPSTALAYFFHCSSASRGLLAIEALDAGLFDDDEAPVVRAFADKVLNLMGRDGLWLANFASESVKSSKAKITIATEATRTDGGWLLNGVKAFGCATGVADTYLVTAKLADVEGGDALCVFLVPRDAEGVSERAKWDALGMRATATHGIILKDVFVADDDALTIPGAFVRMMQVSRGSFVGAQVAGTSVYLGAAQSVFSEAVSQLTTKTFADTGESLASASPMHQRLIGDMLAELEAGYLWLRRQVWMESTEPAPKAKDDVIRTWRLTKGSVAEHANAVALLALKACGTSATGNRGIIARGLRDTSMGLVQAFPSERGRLEAAAMIVTGAEGTQFGTKGNA
ncbi:MAG: alkylation response protein AidB-like acyl-CoA dehydrogenase [Glaciecola sp.]|jgi:alkylation response protein AidB-like acyl-CoA dehydrogenase